MRGEKKVLIHISKNTFLKKLRINQPQGGVKMAYKEDTEYASPHN